MKTSYNIFRFILFTVLFVGCEETEVVEIGPYKPSIDEINNTPHPLPYDNNAYGNMHISDWSNFEYYALQDYTEVKTLRIQGDFTAENPEYTDRLNFFPDLRTITASLNIETAYFSSFVGYGNLESIGDLFTIKGVHTIEDFEGLTSLREINSIYLFDNDSLHTFKGLENATIQGGSIYIRNMTALENFENFPFVEEPTTYVTLQANTTLQSLEGLESIQSIDGDFSLINSPELSSLEGLNLRTVRGDLIISKCHSLENIEALRDLIYVGGDIVFSNNALQDTWDTSFLPSTPIFE